VSCALGRLDHPQLQHRHEAGFGVVEVDLNVLSDSGADHSVSTVTAHAGDRVTRAESALLLINGARSALLTTTRGSQAKPSISRTVGCCRFRADGTVGVAADPEESTTTLRS